MKLFSKIEWQLLWPFYVSRAIEISFFLMTPFMVVYFKGLGLSFFEISSIFALNFATSAICEIPTGAIADTWGRKASVLLRLAIKIPVYCLLPFATSFPSIAILFMLSGLADTLRSGADEAWIADWLRLKKQEPLFADYIAKDTAICFIAGIGGALLASFLLAYIDMKWFWVINAVALVFSGIPILLAYEPFTPHKAHPVELGKQALANIASGWRFSRQHPMVRAILMATLFVWFANSTLENLWQPFMLDVGISLATLGYVFSVASAFSAMATLVGAHIAKKTTQPARLLAIFAFLQFALTFCLGAFTGPVVSISILCGIWFLGPLRFQPVPPFSKPLFHQTYAPLSPLSALP